MKLNTTAFDQLRHMTPAPGVEIDFIGLVLHCGPSIYAGRTQTRCCKVTVTDDHQNQFVLILWDDFDEIEGADLEAKLRKDDDFPLILGRNIGISPYQGPKQADTCFQAVRCPALQGHLRLLRCLLILIQLSPLQKLLHKLLLASFTLRQKCQYQMTFKSLCVGVFRLQAEKTHQRYTRV